MGQESSFQQGFGGGCGLILGIMFAILIIPVMGFIGCTMLIGTALTLPAVKSANEAVSTKTNQSVAATSMPVEKPQGKLIIDPGFRIWMDDTGKHTTEAQFVEASDGLVCLQKRDGSIVRLPFEKLSVADQEWIENANAE